MMSNTVRRSIVDLWDNHPEECDRVYIALHRLQTEGRVAYRRLVGMHGGGGGTSDTDHHLPNLIAKMQADLDQHHFHSNIPLDTAWPGSVPNAAYPAPVSLTCANSENVFAYTFCWHGAAPFILWHRPLMAEFERNLQVYDPKFIGDAGNMNQHVGSEALGAPYWGWEEWDGDTLPIQVTVPEYQIKTNKWADKDEAYVQGMTIPNPFYRWFAPVDLQDQVKEVFPDELNDANCTLRSSAFDDPNQRHDYKWPTVTTTDPDGELVVNMKDNVMNSLANKDWMLFATKGNTQSDSETAAWGEGGGNTSIENPHNQFHNRVGGLTHGGLQGREKQYFFFDGLTTPARLKRAQDEDDDEFDDVIQNSEYMGTMTSNQSIFDPIFWLHHGNIERQHMSWQATHLGNNGVTLPNDDLMNTVLYPWTKPGKLKLGHEGWNSPCTAEYNATFGDWWEPATLGYEYDELIEPTIVPNVTSPDKAVAFMGGLPLRASVPGSVDVAPVRLIVQIKAGQYKNGDFDLYYDGKLIASDSVISAQGTPCARCSGKAATRSLHFEVSRGVGSLDQVEEAINDHNKNDSKFKLTRTGRRNVPIVALKASAWHASAAVLGRKPRKRSKT